MFCITKYSKSGFCMFCITKSGFMLGSASLNLGCIVYSASLYQGFVCSALKISGSCMFCITKSGFCIICDV